MDEAAAARKFNPKTQLKIHLVTLIPPDLISPTAEKFEHALLVYYADLIDHPFANVDGALNKLQTIVLPSIPCPSIQWKVTLAVWMCNIMHLRKQRVITEQIHLLTQIESTIDLLKQWTDKD